MFDPDNGLVSRALSYIFDFTDYLSNGGLSTMSSSITLMLFSNVTESLCVTLSMCEVTLTASQSSVHSHEP